MKNIHEILQAIGIMVPEDKKGDFEKELLENYKTIADYENQTGKVASLSGQLKTATDGLNAFEGVDINDLKGQITKLQGDIASKDTEYQQKIADMEFDTLLSGAVSSAKGRNTKAIKALLDIDTLKTSKNQAVDMKSAIEDLQKEHGYLFEPQQTPPPFAVGTGTTPASSKYTPEIAAIRAASGLKND